MSEHQVRKTSKQDYQHRNHQQHGLTQHGDIGTPLNSVSFHGILGGWQIQGLFERQDGEPLLLPNLYFNGDISQLTSYLGKKDPNGLRYGIDLNAWETGGFAINGTVPGVANNFTSGSAITLRNVPFTVDGLRNQRFLKFDVGVSKNFKIREGMKLQIRVDVINI